MRLNIFVIALTLLLNGCAGLIVAGAATGVSVMHDRRTVGAIVEDENIEVKASQRVRHSDTLSRNSNVNVISFNSRVLVAGQAATPALRSAIGEEISKVEKIQRIHNELRIAAPTSLLTRSSDALISTKVKAMMVAEEGLDASHIKVYTENGEVFLLGLVSEEEARKAISVTRSISGVQRVIELFEYVSL